MEKIKDPSKSFNSRQSRSTIFASKFIFLAAIFIILIISIFSLRQLHNFLISSSWITHTYNVIQNTDDALLNTVDAEAHQRGYLLSNDRLFLMDLDQQQAEAEKAAILAANLTLDNPSQNQTSQRLVQLVKQRFTYLRKTLQNNTGDLLHNPTQLSSFQEGQLVSNELLSTGRQMKAVETSLLVERDRNGNHEAKMTLLVMVIGYSISIAFLLIAYYLSSKELHLRMLSEARQKELEHQLHSIIEGASDMIAAIDLNFKYFMFNSAYEKQFKFLFDKQIAVGMTLQDALHDVDPDKGDKLLSSWQKSFEGIEYTKLVEFVKDNKTYTYELTSSSVYDSKGQLHGAVHIIRNITERMNEQLQLKNVVTQLNTGITELQNKDTKITLLVEMSNVLLASSSIDELGGIVTHFCERILDFSRGALYIMHPSKNYLESIAQWNSPIEQTLTFMQENCWGLRLGRMHIANSATHNIYCKHIADNSDKTLNYICVPLMAQNDIYGLLYLEVPTDPLQGLADNKKLIITAFAELAALSLANVHLRENLRFQSIRDSLTGLYNRRYLEEFLLKTILQSERAKLPFATLMIDVDHFKKINDFYGHDAGDIALKELANVLKQKTRGGDLMARYGGEEFICILYNTDRAAAEIRAEDLRKAVTQISVKYGAQNIGSFTISIGGAMYPQDAKATQTLIELADQALYQAKNSGRNRVVFAQPSDPNEK